MVTTFAMDLYLSSLHTYLCNAFGPGGDVTLDIAAPIYRSATGSGCGSGYALSPPTGARVLVMLHAYIDDSGTHDDAEVVSMGAFVARFEDWVSFELDWCAILDREPIEAFHMSHCEAGGKPFDWSWARRAALIHDLRHVIIRYQMLGTAFSISRKDWDAIIIGAVREHFGNAIEFAFGGAIGQLVSYLRRLWPKEKLAIIVDDQKQRKEDLSENCGPLRRSKGFIPRD